jgi:hypothetical protein
VDNFVDKSMGSARKPCAARLSTDCPKGKQNLYSLKINDLEKQIAAWKNLFSACLAAAHKSIYVNKFAKSVDRHPSPPTFASDFWGRVSRPRSCAQTSSDSSNRILSFGFLRSF